MIVGEVALNKSAREEMNLPESLVNSFWKPLIISSPEDLKAIEDESCREALYLLHDTPKVAESILRALIQDWELRKILSDMYVWKRVAALEKGINNAIKKCSDVVLPKRTRKVELLDSEQ